MRKLEATVVTVVILIIAIPTAIFFQKDRTGEEKGAIITVLTPDRTIDVRIEGGPVKISKILDRCGIDQDMVTLAYCEGGRIENVSGDPALSVDDGIASYDGSDLIGLATIPDIFIPSLSGVRDLALAGLNLTPLPEGLNLPRTGRVVMIELDAAGWSPLRAVSSPLPNITGSFNSTCCLSAYPPITNVGNAFALTGAPPSENGISERSDHTLKLDTIFQTASVEGLNATWLESDIGFLDAEMELNSDQDGDGTSDDEILDRTIGRIAAGDELVLAHFHSFDDAVHDGGPDSAGAASAIRVLDSYVGRITEAVGSTGVPTLLILFSDHGAHSTSDGGGHGEFVHEDMYSFLSWSVVGGAMDETVSLSILIDGATKTELTMPQLRSLESVRMGYSLRSSKSNLTNVYTGIPLRDLLALAGVDGDPAVIKLVSSDGFGTSIDPSWSTEQEVIVAYLKDGTPMIEEGPLRLIVPQGLAGEFNAQYCVKFLIRIEVRT